MKYFGIILGIIFLLLVRGTYVSAQVLCSGGVGGSLYTETAPTDNTMLFANGLAWVALVPSGDWTCTDTGVCTVVGINTDPIVGTLTPGTAGLGYLSNTSNQMVPAAFANDPATTIGDMLYASAIGTPNTYSRIPATTQGFLITENGTGTAPTAQANEAPLPIPFSIDGTISNSTNRIRVCPVTLRVAPGFATSYPFVASQATIGTNPSQTDTYTLTDVTNSNASVGTAVVTSGGVWSFNTTGCSASFDGTQGSTAWSRVSNGTTVN